MHLAYVNRDLGEGRLLQYNWLCQSKLFCHIWWVLLITPRFLCLLSCRFDLKTLPVDFVECLMRFLPTENEVKVLRLYERERKPLENLSDEDRFMMQFSKIERLMQKMTIMAFIGNFAESIQMLTPVRETQMTEPC